MKDLKFKKDVEVIPLTEDFYYMLVDGGWCRPEKFLEDEDAKMVGDALKLIEEYRRQAIEKGFFEEV